MRSLRATIASVALATLATVPLAGSPVLADKPGPIWGAIPGQEVDREWSRTYYAVAKGAVRPRERDMGETQDDRADRDTAWQSGITLYLMRVHHMVGCMNLPDGAERDMHCAMMRLTLHPDFEHWEGRRAGFRVRGKEDLIRAGQDRAFRLSGFYALVVKARVVSSDVVQVFVCYFHDEQNPEVKGDGWILPSGREAIPRTAVETVTRDLSGQWRIKHHIAMDGDTMLITKGCAGL